MVKYLHAKTCRVAGAGDSVAEALSASLRICREESKVSGPTSVTARTRGMPLAHTVPVALAAPGAGQGAGAGPAGGEVHEADGALVALGSGEARPTNTVSSSKASVSQFIILGIIGSYILMFFLILKLQPGSTGLQPLPHYCGSRREHKGLGQNERLLADGSNHPSSARSSPRSFYLGS